MKPPRNSSKQPDVELYCSEIGQNWSEMGQINWLTDINLDMLRLKPENNTHLKAIYHKATPSVIIVMSFSV